MQVYDFPIESTSEISLRFLVQGVTHFAQAGKMVAGWKYGRNADKTNLARLFEEERGTCSTKHALLKQLAEECGRREVRLMLGVYKMNAQNTPKAGETLTRYGLAYLPEAHNYLKVEGAVMDFTLPAYKKLLFEPDLLQEIEIDSTQITDFKVTYHQTFLKHWLVENSALAYTLEQIWQIREECIQALSSS